MDLGLRGMRAIVTGGSRGIGRATAEALAEEGCAVGLCARGREGVDEAVGALRAKGVDAYGDALDVSEADRLRAWVRDAAAALGGLDIVIANVSALGDGEGEQGWRNSFDVDLMHTVRVVEEGLPLLRSSEAPAIVIVSTVAAREAGAFEGPYGTLKAALNRYGRGLAHSLAPDGIRVNVVSPGTIYFEGGFWHDVERDNPVFYRQAVEWNPLGRMGTPREVARAIVFLASPAASFISGTNLIVDGSLTRGVQT